MYYGSTFCNRTVVFPCINILSLIDKVLYNNNNNRTVVFPCINILSLIDKVLYNNNNNNNNKIRGGAQIVFSVVAISYVLHRLTKIRSWERIIFLFCFLINFSLLYLFYFIFYILSPFCYSIHFVSSFY